MKVTVISTIVALVAGMIALSWANGILKNDGDTIEEASAIALALSKWLIPVSLAFITGIAAFLLALGLYVGALDNKIDRNRAQDKKESSDTIAAVNAALSEMRAIKYGRDVRALMNDRYIKILFKEDHILKRFGVSAADQFFSSFEVSDDLEGVQFNGQDASIRSNTTFWEAMTELQEKRRKDNPIRVFVTHSNSIRIWESSRAEALYDAQKLFTDAGGTICRIFIDVKSGDNNQMLEHYIGVMRKMNNNGILTAYLPQDFDGVTNSGRERYDFIFTEVNGSKYALSWSASTHNNYIISSRMEVNSPLYTKNKGDWDYFFEALRSYDYVKLDIDVANRNFLTTQRDKVVSIIST